jgi:predicted Zn-dependent protease
MQNILGLSAFNLGRTDTAVNALTEAIKLNPGNPVYHRDIGLVYKRLNRYNEAKEHFEKAAASTNSSEALRAEVLRELESLKNSQYQLQEFNKYGQ